MSGRRSSIVHRPVIVQDGGRSAIVHRPHPGGVDAWTVTVPRVTAWVGVGALVAAVARAVKAGGRGTASPLFQTLSPGMPPLRNSAYGSQNRRACSGYS